MAGGWSVEVPVHVGMLGAYMYSYVEYRVEWVCRVYARGAEIGLAEGRRRLRAGGGREGRGGKAPTQDAGNIYSSRTSALWVAWTYLCRSVMHVM